MVRATVRCHDGRPVEIRWPLERPTATARVVRSLDDWDYVGRWWVDEVRRRYHLLEVDEGRVLEVFDEGGDWWLSRAND